MVISRLAAKAQTTLPEPVRAALRLEPGDDLMYEIVGQRVIVTKARSGGKIDYPFRTFSEWSSAADANAYARL